MREALRKWWWELVCFCLLFILVGYQIFLPPVTGLANNSDFVYVLGKLSICPADRESQDKVYLVTDYFVDALSCTWESGLTTVEVPLAIAAEHLSRPFTGKKNFDLRALAALHLVLLLTAFGILLSLTRRAGPAIRFGIPGLFILIFSDVAYTCYLNSVYLDAPAYLFLLITTAVAVAASLDHRSHRIAAAFLVFATALVFSKSQHAVLGFFFAALAVVLAFRPAKRIFRMEWIGIAVLLSVSAGTMLSLTPPHYKLYALYNVIFSRLAPHSQMPWDVLQQVGLGDDDMKLVGSHAYIPGAPVYNDEWSEDFLRRTSFGKLIRYYLQNPDVVVSEMDRDLKLAAPVLRPTDMANFRQKDGYPPAMLATRFSFWSDLRRDMLRQFPYHVLVIYLAPWLMWIAGWRWARLRSPVMPLALILSAAGVMEFGMSALTDALDNSRHLFLFQIITEVMILTFAAGLLQLAPVAAGQRAAVAAPERRPLAGRLPRFAKLPRIDAVAALRSSLRAWGWEIGCLAVFFALVGYQLFLPPVTGLANNSDFLKVMGPWSICSDHQPQNNRSLVTHYAVDPQCQYDLGITTLERPLVGAARTLSSFFTGDKVFDLRYLAGLHLAILLAGFAILLGLTRRAAPAMRFGLPVLFILIFTDVAYTCYLNSAYMDAPAYAVLLVATAVAAWACFRHESWFVTIAYLVAGLALIFAKSQHAVLGFFFAAVAGVFAWRSVTRARRIRWAAVAALLMGSMVTMLSITPESYSLFAIYSVIFARLAPHSDNALAMLQEVGLGAGDMQYIGTNSYTPGAPLYTALWAEDFLRRTSFSDLILYYLHHPTVPIREMDSDLRLAAPVIRPPEMPNFREEDGIPAGTMATRFSLWSNLRSAALHVFPYHVFLFYLAPWVAALVAWKFKMDRLRWPLLPLALALSAGGLVEFAMASLTDALDIARHLFMFHVITEVLILMTTAALLSLFSRRPKQIPAAAGVEVAGGESVVKSERVYS